MTALDRKLIGGLVLLAACLFLGRFWPVPQQGLNARVELASKLVQTINLEQLDGKTVIIQLPRGRAELEVKGQAVKLREMPDELCPRKICSHSGWIRRPGEMLICLPNRLVIRLVGNAKRQVDVIAR
ncbi:MAG TPA: NusG domain II-containing protein [Bacillota bacterium]|nr:NusG domain II-containing protein [Bacillota bacterium]